MLYIVTKFSLKIKAPWRRLLDGNSFSPLVALDSTREIISIPVLSKG